MKKFKKALALTSIITALTITCSSSCFLCILDNLFNYNQQVDVLNDLHDTLQKE